MLCSMHINASVLVFSSIPLCLVVAVRSMLPARGLQAFHHFREGSRTGPGNPQSQHRMPPMSPGSSLNARHATIVFYLFFLRFAVGMLGKACRMGPQVMPESRCLMLIFATRMFGAGVPGSLVPNTYTVQNSAFDLRLCVSDINGDSYPGVYARKAVLTAKAFDSLTHAFVPEVIHDFCIMLA